MKKYKDLKFTTKRTIEAMVFLVVFFVAFGILARRMGTPNMLNTMMKTAHDLLLNTCFYLMGITVLTGALGRLLTEFGVVRLLENILRPLMKPLFNLPGVAALGAVLTFLSDNPAIISLAHDKNFSSYFKKYQLISLTNFGTAFGMGLVVIAFMVGKGYGMGASIGLLGAVVGSIVSTRLMQRAIIKAYPQYKEEEASGGDKEKISFKSEGGVFIRGLNAILDGGKDGVQLGLAIIPGVIVISTVVMMITFGTGAGGSYTGAAYEGVPLLPWLAGKVNFLFEWLFGFQHPELIAFPITALGAVGAALGLVPTFIAEGFVDNNVIAVFTAMGMCWSGYLSTHSAMLDSLGYRNLVPKAIGAHTIGGLCAGVSAHLFYLLFSLVF
ncbi:MAG: nucleoside recognition domain-containing protein [Bacteroidales bacterium]|nr:nucleoside recognition domain-containing protein [Bacteroidales bacterium]MDE6629964.1 nucleoside recognition domain-containing protein [Bacteroidales bacterium]